MRRIRLRRKVRDSTKVFPKSKFFKPKTRMSGFKRELTPTGRSVRSTKRVDIIRQTTYRDRFGHIRKREAVKIR